MDPAFKRLAQSIKKRIPMALSVAADPGISADTKIQLLTEVVGAMPFAIDVLECLDLEATTLRKELERTRAAELGAWEDTPNGH